MASRSPFTMSGAVSGSPMSATPSGGSWFYVALRAITDRSSGLMRVAIKAAGLMSMRSRSSGLMSVTTQRGIPSATTTITVALTVDTIILTADMTTLTADAVGSTTFTQNVVGVGNVRSRSPSLLSIRQR